MFHLDRKAAFFALLLLAACGGGGGSSGSVVVTGFQPSASAWVHVFYDSQVIVRYAADAGTGNLYPEGHVPNFFHNFVIDLAVGRGGEIVYGLDTSLDRIDIGRVHPGTMAIRKDGSYAVSGLVTRIKLGARERFLFTMASDEIRALSIAADGTLSDTGGVASSPGHDLITDPTGRLVAQLDQSPSELRVFTVDVNGVMTPVDADPATADVQGFEIDPGTRVARFAPSGNFLYTASRERVVAYRVESSGALTHLADAMSGELTFAQDLAFDAEGTTLHALHSVGSIASYSVDVETGLLARLDADGSMPGVQNTPTDVDPVRAELGPSGSRLIVAFGSGRVASFELDPASGLPEAAQRFPGSRTGRPRRLVIAKRDTAALRAPRFLYLAGRDSSNHGQIATYAIDGATGDVSFIDTTPTALFSSRLATDRAHRFLYAINGEVDGFRVDAETGTLTPMGIVLARAEGHFIIGAAINPSGWASYAAVGAARVGSEYGFNSYNTGLDATLEPLGNWGQSLFGVPDPSPGYSVGDVAVDPIGQTAYHAQILEIRAYPIRIDNVVQARLDASPAAGQQDFYEGVIAVRLEVDPLGRHLFSLSPFNAMQADNFLRSYRIEASGAIVLADSEVLLDEADDLAIHPTGRFVYAGVPDASSIQSYRVDQDTGELAPVETVALASPGGTGFLAMDPSGRFLYVSTSESSVPAIERWKIDPETGVLSDLTTVASPPFTGSVLVMGRFE